MEDLFMENLFIAVIASLAGLTHSPSADTDVAVDRVSVEQSESAVEEYITSSNSDCKIINPYPQDNETIEWHGECKDGYAHGEGVAQWYIDGELYEEDRGIFNQGKPNGYFTFEWYDEGVLISKYSGEMFDGKRTLGTINYYDDSGFRMYSGGWKDFEFHGQGMLQLTNGNTYTGRFENGAISGYGVLSLSNDNKDTIALWQDRGLGYYQGNRYILEGIYKENELDIECKKEDCPAEYFDSRN